jgi:hypothetical protein
MALKLEIDNADARGRVDYTRYLASPDHSPAVLRDRMNLPALLDFSLAPADDFFLVPRRSAYVRLIGLADALPPGGPRVAGPLFTGYITNEPAIEFLGTRNARLIYAYRFQATSEEYLLNIKRIGLLPPFLNQTAGQILRFLIEHLQPGRFDLAGVADGAFIPQFAAGPERSCSDIARELAERSGFYYRVLDAKVLFQPVDDGAAGVAIDERDRRFRPDALEVTPLGNPIQNDVTVLGESEPQAWVREYFVGDGFTSRFPLSAGVFGTTSACLLADDFTGAAFDSTRWQKADPGDHITLFDGRLNVTGGTGILNATTLVARQALELGGELELVHGEIEFVAASTGILGGLYQSAALTLANCLLGFDASPTAGGGTRLRALVGGAVQAPEVVVQADHHYVLVTRLSADQQHRTQQSYASLGGVYGGASIPAFVRAVLEVREIDLANPAAPATIVLFDSVLTALPAFALYAPINSADLHLAANFLQVTQPIQAQLETQALGEAAQVRKLGFGIAQHDATITADPNRNQWALEFYEDTIPARGERIALAYRAAGRAKARVRNAASITAEAALAGDDGVRANMLRDVNPAPRTSAEAALAAQAYLADHTLPRYEGRYTTWGELCDSYPRSGRRIQIANESRYPIFTALIREVTSELRELGTERILHTLEFGQPSRFEDLLRQLAPAESVLRGEEDGPLAAVETAEAGTQFIADLAGAAVADVLSGNFVVDAGAAPPAGGSFEVRRSDQGWSNAGRPGSGQNLAGNFTAQSFLLPRTARKHVYFVRPVDAEGRTSRYSAALAVHHPLVPVAPAALNLSFGVDDLQRPVIRVEVVLNESGIADVDLVELRDADNSTVLARWEFGQLAFDGAAYRARLTLDNSTALLRSKTLYAYTQNALGEYSTARSATASELEPTKPFLTPGNSVGQVLEILLDAAAGTILETQVQAAEPGGGFTAPAQDVLLPGQPEKFSFVAPRSGGWLFRARRRDTLGWSPWSTESQGQLPAQTLVYFVQFFQAPELAPSIGAAINSQNLLPNSDFFLNGLAGQEGTHAARYFALVNALGDGSEVDYSGATNEMQWKSGVNFASADPGFRSLLGNLGGLFNPGESLTLSAALRHSGTLTFPRAVRFALRSASAPSFDRSAEIPAGTITENYAWYSATFTLPAGQQVPADLSSEIAVVAAAGQSLASSLYCDKLILNRGHRPAAFSLAPWDVVPLAWNASAGAYDLPATAVAPTPRSSDPGTAGQLLGTGTEDSDPDFSDRYFRQVA